MSTIITHTDLKCPYCGFVNRVAVEDTDLYKYQVFHCSVDDGGCDRAFVYRHTITIKNEIMRVEGQAEIEHEEETKYVAE